MKNYLFHISIGLLGIAAFAVLGLRLYFIYIASPNLGAMETSVVYGLQRVLGDLPLYSNPEEAPFAIIQYSPLYYAIVGMVGKWLAVDPDQPMQVYILSRWAGLIFNLMGLGLLGYILKQLSLEKTAKIALILIAWLCLEPAHYARQDSLQSLWFLVFVALGLQYVKKGTLLTLLGIVAAATLACWTKQNGIFLPLFFLFYLLFVKKNHRHFAIATGGFMILNAMIWLISVADTEVFLANIIQGVDNGISPVYFLSAIYDAGVKKYFPFFLIGIYLALIWVFNPVSSDKKWIGWLLGGSFAFASVTALKWGSIPAYYTDFVYLTLIAAAYWGGAYQQQKGKLFPGQSSIFAGICLLLIIALHTSGKEWGRVVKEGQSEWVAQAEEIRTVIRKQGLQADEHIFTHDYLINLFVFRQCLFPQNDIVYCCAEPRETYDYFQFETLLRAGRVKYVIDWKNRDPRPFLGLSFEGYHQVDSIGPYMIWRHSSPD